MAAPYKFRYRDDYPADTPILYTINADGSDTRALVNLDPEGGLKAANYRPRSFWGRFVENVNRIFQQ